MKTSLFKATAALGLAVIAMTTYADQGNSGKGMDMSNMKGMKMDRMDDSSMKALPMSDAEVKAVDKANKSITLKHGPIKSKTVEMGPMTMSFPVKDPALLSQVKAGDKVKFNVENVGNVATVTALIVQK